MLGTLTSDLIQIGLSTIATAAAAIVLGGTAIVGSSVAAPLIIAIGVGIATNWVLSEIDEHVGVTKALIEAYRRAGVELSEIEYSVARWHNFFEESPRALMQLFGKTGTVRIPFGHGY